MDYGLWIMDTDYWSTGVLNTELDTTGRVEDISYFTVVNPALQCTVLVLYPEHETTRRVQSYSSTDLLQVP